MLAPVSTPKDTRDRAPCQAPNILEHLHQSMLHLAASVCLTI